MVKILGNDIYRDHDKIGHIESNHIFDHAGKKLGYYDMKHIYDANTDKVAYIENDELYDHAGHKKGRVTDINESIEGILGSSGKCAVYVFLGT